MATIQGSLSQKERVWILLALATAAIKCGEYKDSYDALHSLFEEFTDTEIVVGNPYVHLLAGLTAAGLGERDEKRIDNIARTFISGGPELFHSEEPVLLNEMKEILELPENLGTWDGYEGST